MNTITKHPQTWETYYREMSGIASELIGASRAHKEMGTGDERIAQTFREYAARFEAVEVPA